MDPVLIKNYNDAVKRARECERMWEEAGKPWNCNVKDKYDAACEVSKCLRQKIISLGGEEQAGQLAMQAIIRARLNTTGALNS